MGTEELLNAREQMMDDKLTTKQLVEEVERLRQYADGLERIIQGVNVGTWDFKRPDRSIRH